MNVVDYTTIDLSNISFENPEKYKGSYICLGKYNDEDLYIQTPMMTNLDGVHKTDTRAHLDLYFEKNHIGFYDFLGDFDDNNIQTIFKKSQDWFHKTIPVDILDDLYSTPLKHKNPPRFKLRIPLSRGQVDVPIIDIENTVVDASDIPNNCRIVALMKFIGLKFLKEQVSCEWMPVQLKVCQKVESKKKSLIVLEKESDNEEQDEEIELEIEELPDNLEIEVEVEEPNNSENEENELIEQEPIQKSVEQELEELKQKYAQRESEFEQLKNVLKNYL
jgi:hypothetical protein